MYVILLYFGIQKIAGSYIKQLSDIIWNKSIAPSFK